MSITLTNDGTTIALPPDLYWSDEFDYDPVKKSVDTTITGALVVQVGVMQAGRPITLEPEDDSSAWMKRELVQQLRNWAAVPDLALTLNIRGVARTVQFRQQDGAVVAKPVVHYRDPTDDDNYLCTIRFMET